MRANLFSSSLSLRHRDGKVDHRSTANSTELDEVLNEVMGLTPGLFNVEDLVGLASRGRGKKLVPSARFV